MKHQTFKDFYPIYLAAHKNKTCRRLHFVGTSIVIALLFYVIVTRDYNKIILAPIVGYSFAWTGHVVFEKNRPATFGHPIYSLMGDFLMFWQLLLRKKLN